MAQTKKPQSLFSGPQSQCYWHFIKRSVHFTSLETNLREREYVNVRERERERGREREREKQRMVR